MTNAAIQSKAASKAQKSQETAGDKALAFQREQYQQARSEFNPYQQAGYGALGRLNLEAGIGRPEFRPGQPQPAAPEAFGSAARQLGAPIGLPPTGPPPTLGGEIPAAAPPAREVGPGPARLFQPNGPSRPLSVPGGPPAGPGPIGPPGPSQAALWTLQAPDGTTAQYPADVAQQFVAKGARRVA